ncbi:uncharacterized protein LOC120334089 isoform X2 [Styela clava]
MMKCFLAIFASAVLASCTGKDLENLQTIVFPNCAPRSIYGMPGIACGKSGKVRCTCQTQYISKKIETWVFQRNEETNLWEKVLQTVKFTVPGGCKCTRFMSEYALEREIDG